MRKSINDIDEIKSVNDEIFQAYVLKINDTYTLSILTASHWESANLGTLEIALLNKGYFAFGDEESDNSIIHYIKPNMAKEMVNEMKQAISNDMIENIFKAYKEKADKEVYENE